MRNVALFGFTLAVAGACANGETIGASGEYEYTDDGGFGDGGTDGAGGGAATGGVVTSSGGSSSGGRSTSGGTPNASGGRGAGGATNSGGAAPGDGGTPSAGGTQSAGGSAATGGAGDDGGTGCPAGQKECTAGCMTPNPGIGCGLTGCTPCPEPPADGYATCASGACAFECYLGFEKNAGGDACQPEGGGSSGGSGQGGGSTGTACQNGNASSCPACTVVQGQKCCTSGGRCGCPIFYIPGTCG